MIYIKLLRELPTRDISITGLCECAECGRYMSVHRRPTREYIDYDEEHDQFVHVRCKYAMYICRKCGVSTTNLSEWHKELGAPRVRRTKRRSVQNV